MLTDQLPYEVPLDLGWGSNNLFQKPIRPPSEFNADVNGQLDEIVSKALQFKASDRYQTAVEMLDALDRWRPATSPASAKSMPPDFSKEALGTHQVSRNEEIATQMTKDSMDLKRQGRLTEAADLMEEAFNKSPELRQKYAHQVKLWRCGISM
jgi:serine/threonine-protein kinase